MLNVVTLGRRAGIAAMLMLVAMLAACTPSAAPEPSEPTYEGAPVVMLASPLANDTYREGAAVNILVRVENAGPDIGRVAVRVNDEIIGEITQPNADTGSPAFTITNLWTPPETGNFTISAVASRLDGTSSDVASVPITVVENPNVVSAPVDNTGGEPSTAQDANQGAPSTDDTTQDVNEQASAQPTPVPAQPTPAPAQPTPVPAEPTPVPPSATPSQPQARIVTGANLRTGPSTQFGVAGSFAAGTVTDLLAVNPAGTWYKIQYYNGDAWILGTLIEITGNAASLPVDAGPPLPPTAVPVTNTPVAVADLSIVDWTTSPFPLACGQPASNAITVANSGTGESGPTAVIVEDLYNGQVQASQRVDITGLQPGGNTAINIEITVSTFVLEGHTLRVRVDPDNVVAETNEGNNVSETPYSPLAQGSC